MPAKAPFTKAVAAAKAKAGKQQKTTSSMKRLSHSMLGEPGAAPLIDFEWGDEDEAPGARLARLMTELRAKLEESR